MVVSIVMRCPLCGERHPVSDARSFDPEEMGCNIAAEARIFDSNLESTVAEFDEITAARSGQSLAAKGYTLSEGTGHDYQPSPGENPLDSDYTRRTFDNGQ